MRDCIYDPNTTISTVHTTTLPRVPVLSLYYILLYILVLLVMYTCNCDLKFNLTE